MSENESPLGPNAAKAIGGLAVFGVVILAVSFVATRGPETPNTGASEENATSPTSCSFPDFGDDGWVLEAPPGSEGEPPLSDAEFVTREGMIGVYKHTDACLREGEMVMIVEGLPDVSGVYSSRDGNLAIEGWSEEPGGFDQTVGRCYVDQDHLFRTKIVHSGFLFDEDGEETDHAVLTTIDVATTGGGPLAGAVVEVGGVATAGGVGAANFLPTHVYNPGSGAVTASFDVWDKNNWTGVAEFESKGETETYNSRDFSPWTDTQYQGSPNHHFRVTLICK